jgi:8-oxo-dGTP pyrophosphatase MutT (NUDIX family)
MDTDIILVREFRVSSASADGYIWELPGGSSPDSGVNPLELAAEECKEETGLAIDPSRFKFHGARQMAATLSSYKANIYSCEISEQELEYFRSQKGISHGLQDHSEVTYIEVIKLGDIIAKNKADWPTLGMIFSVLTSVL